VVGRALGGHADVDDVVQETMLRALQGLSRLREPERFRAWLVSIAIRQVHDRGRGLSRHPGLAFDRRVPVEPAAEPADPGPDFVDATIERLGLAEERRTVVEASEWLSVADRRVLALWWQEVAGSLSRAEVAAALSTWRTTAATPTGWRSSSGRAPATW
jgi:RNA polymerase sigma factor (sigma-70 family)